MRVVALAGLVIFVCFSVTFGTFLLVRIVTLILPSSLTQLRIITDVLRVVLAVTLAYCWLRVWKRITDWYFWRSLGAFMRVRDNP